MLHLDRIELAQDSFRLSADWTVPAGDRVAILGPSGAGKSTLLAAIAGFLPPVRGRILWDGADLAALPPGKRPVTILFQDHNLFPNLTVEANLGLGLSPRLRLNDAQRGAIAEALVRVGLDGMENRLPGQLSGGQQGRVALARALLRARPILLLDEPFSALGPGLRRDMLDLVVDIGRQTGATLLLVTHDPADAIQLNGSAVFVSEGQALAPRPVADLLADPPAPLRDYLGTSRPK